MMKDANEVYVELSGRINDLENRVAPLEGSYRMWLNEDVGDGDRMGAEDLVFMRGIVAALEGIRKELGEIRATQDQQLHLERRRPR